MNKSATKTARRHLNIVVPMAGVGQPFVKAGYAFPKPIIEINGETMIEVVIKNLKPKKLDYTFIFVCQKEHYQKFDLYNIFKRATDNHFEVVELDGRTEGAACTVLTASRYINNAEDLIIANSDQVLDWKIDDFVDKARRDGSDGQILTFPSSHPKWSYALLAKDGRVIETAEKKVISSHATAGIYYFRQGSDFVSAAQAMIRKNIRYNNEFYVCPVYNEFILAKKKIQSCEIQAKKMHSLGTPEDLIVFLKALEKGTVKI